MMASSSGSVLLVEDDAAIAMVIETALGDEGLSVKRCDSLSERDALLASHQFDLMLTDVMLTDGDGVEGLAQIRERYGDLPVIILSAQNTLDTAVRAADSGAFEYFPKPFDLDALVEAAKQAVVGTSAGAARAEPAAEPEPLVGPQLVGRSPAMQGVYRMITRVLNNDLTVLVLGESGTGKELVAEAIHQLGHRKSGPFIALNAGAIPANLVESELFGHEKGAFTGAVSQHIGKFEQAGGGTLFLDEIGDMPAEAQTRLLRALQSGRIRRVGGRHDIAADVRIIAATNRDLRPMIADGQFREDLFYRLNVVPITLPPLRERPEDISALAQHFLREAEEEGLPARRLSDTASECLSREQWPGNVRELRNFVFRLAIMAREEVIDDHFISVLLKDSTLASAAYAPDSFESALKQWWAVVSPEDGEIYRRALAAFEAPLFRDVLTKTAGNQVKAAQILGINRNTLRKKLSELGIDAGEFVQ